MSASKETAELHPYSINIEPQRRRCIEMAVQIGPAWEYGLDSKLPWKTPGAVRHALEQLMDRKLVVYGWRTWAKLTEAQQRRGNAFLVLGGDEAWRTKAERRYRDLNEHRGGPKPYFMRPDALWGHTENPWQYGLQFAEMIRQEQGDLIDGIVIAGGQALCEGALRMDMVDVLHIFSNRTRDEQDDKLTVPRFVKWKHTHRFSVLHPLGWVRACKWTTLVTPSGYGQPDWSSTTLVRDPQAPPLAVGTEYDQDIYRQSALIW